MPRPGEDRSDVGGAAQFNNIGPVPLSCSRPAFRSREFSGLSPVRRTELTRPRVLDPALARFACSGLCLAAKVFSPLVYLPAGPVCLVPLFLTFVLRHETLSFRDDALIGIGTTRLSARAVSFSNASLAAACLRPGLPARPRERCQGRWRRHRLDMAPQRLVIDFRVADQCAHACLFPYGQDVLG